MGVEDAPKQFPRVYGDSEMVKDDTAETIITDVLERALIVYRKVFFALVGDLSRMITQLSCHCIGHKRLAINTTTMY